MYPERGQDVHGQLGIVRAVERQLRRGEDARTIPLWLPPREAGRRAEGHTYFNLGLVSALYLSTFWV